MTRLVLKIVPTEPMFERVKVPPVRSAGASLDAVANDCSRLRSLAISNMLFVSQFFMFGTIKPSLESMAIPILCDALKTNVQ